MNKKTNINSLDKVLLADGRASVEYRKILNDKELALTLDPTGRLITPWTLRRWRLIESMPFMQFGRRILFNLESVEAWMKAREQGVSKTVAPENGILRRID